MKHCGKDDKIAAAAA